MGAAIIIIGIIVMVIIHEGGHFVAAKIFGMKATEAFWGFGPKLWSTRRGETEYGVKALPLGGYVRIVGMNPLEEVDPDEEHRTYRAKPFWQKTIVVLAGITSHFVVAALIVFFLVFAFGSTSVGDGQLTLEIESVTAVLATPNTDPADEVALRTLRGDEVVSVDGVPIVEIDPNVTKAAGEISVVEIFRDGETMTIETTDVVRPSPARIVGVQPGDRLVEFAGEPVGDWIEFVDRARQHPGAVVDVVLERAGELVSYNVPLTINVLPDGQNVGFFGVSPVVVDKDLSFFGSVSLGVSSFGRMSVGVAQGFWAFVTNIDDVFRLAFNPTDTTTAEVRPVSVIGLVQIAGPVEEALLLLAFVNLFVGYLNLVPLYPLDGGHFAVAAYEKIRGRPADIRPLIPVAAVVFVFIVALGLVGIYLDIVDPIRF